MINQINPSICIARFMKVQDCKLVKKGIRLSHNSKAVDVTISKEAKALCAKLLNQDQHIIKGG